MSLTVTSTPEVQANSDADTVSRYFSLNRPILFELTRGSDFAFSGITANSATTATVTATGFGAAWYNTVTPGTDFQIYIYDSDIPEGYYTVTSDILVGSNSFVIDITGMGLYPGSYTAGNLKIIRSNYRLRTKITVDSVVIATIVNRFNASDVATVDVSPFLKSLLTYDDDYNYTTINAKDETRCKPFTLEFAEFWSGHEGTYDAEGTSTYYYVNSVFQLNSDYDGNMAAYVPFDNYDSDDVRAKFLCDFETPTFWSGYPFSLDWIFNDDMNTSTYDFKRFEEQFDVNLTSVTSSNTALLETDKGYVNRMILSDSYNASTKYLDVWIEKALAS